MFTIFGRKHSARTAGRSVGTTTKLCLEVLEGRCLLSAYSTAILADHPAAYYRLGEASGTTASDSSGNGHTGTYLGGPSLGQPGALASDMDTSVRFNGIDYTHGSIVDTSFSPNDASFTVEAWIKPAAAVAQEWVVEGRGGWGGLAYNAWDGRSQPVHATAGYVGISIFDGVSFDVTLSSAPLPLNQWTYVAGRWDDSTKSLDLYVNGVLNQHQTFPGKTSMVSHGGTTIQVGAFNETLHGSGPYNAEYFQGGIDEVAYYSSTLSSAQIQHHYEAGTQVPDIAAASLTWNTAQAGLDFGYKVSGVALTQDTTAALYWSSSDKFADAIDPAHPLYSTTIEHPVHDYGPFYVPNAVLGKPPAGATHLLLVTDPPDATHPNGLIDETDETNNVKALAIPDIVMDSATTTDSKSVTFEYDINNAPIGGFHVLVYRAAHNDPNDKDVVTVGDDTTQLFPGSLGPHTKTVTLQTSLVIDPAHPYVFVKADSDDSVIETDKKNNYSWFQTHVLGAIAHGFELIPFSSIPDWEKAMASSLKTSSHYEDVIPFSWTSTAWAPFPGLAVVAGDRLYKQVVARADQLAAVHSGDVVDIHFIGHSRGAVVVSRALQDLVGTKDPALQGGYMTMTLLDPHPASPLFYFGEFSINPSPIISPLGVRLAQLLFGWQAAELDPPVVVPANVQEVDMYFQHTPASRISLRNPNLEGVLNFWGLIPGQIIIANRTKTKVTATVDLTGKTCSKGVVGHTEVPWWYLENIL